MRSIVRRYEDGVIGLPENGQYIAVSNSEIGRLACERRYWFGEIEHLKSPGSRKADMGTAFHAIVEDMYLWWAAFDRPYPTSGLDSCPFCHDGQQCAYCGGTGESALKRAVRPFALMLEGDHERDPEITPEEYQHIQDQLYRAADGYLRRYHNGPLDTLEVVGTEIPLARMILDPRTGQPFAPTTYLELTHNGWRHATTMAVERGFDGRVVQWPWFLIGKLDVLLRDRKTKSGWVLDHKYTGQSRSFEQKMQYDPQLPGYCWLLENELETFGLSGVSGFIYDCINSVFHADPKQLQWKPPSVASMKEQCRASGIDVKGIVRSEDFMRILGITEGHGGFSQASNVTVPSWRYEQAIKEAGLDPAPYDAHLDWIAQNVDPGLYRRDWLNFGAERRVRFAKEVYAKARMISNLRVKAATLTDIRDIDIEFPREPICQQPGGFCQFSHACVHDEPETRATFTVTPSQSWGDTGTVVTVSQQEDQGEF